MPDDIDAQAIRWFVRLRAPTATDEDRRAHAEWLTENVDHELAYARIEQHWHDMGELESWGRTELRRMGLAWRTRAGRHVRLSVAGMLAAAASLTLVAVWWGMSGESRGAAEVIHIVTEKAEQRHLALDDGSRLHVNTASDLEVRYTAQIREIVVNTGESLFDVKHHGDRPFVVRAGRHSVIAVGTRFAVRLKHDGEWAVTVIEGRVAVVPGTPSNPEEFAALLSSLTSSSHERGVILGADERAEIDQSGQVLTEEEMDAAAATAWHSGMLKFRQTPLREVAREISRYTLGEVRVADSVPDHPVTGIIHIRNRETMVGYLIEVVPLTAVEGGAGVTVLHGALDADASS